MIRRGGIIKVITKDCTAMLYVTFVVNTICIVVLLSWPLSFARADEGGPQLPPRHPPPATPGPGNDDGDHGHNPPPGAYIELQTQAAPPEAWTKVQWQDQAGDWHEVEGWQGTLESGGNKRWWVAAKDFGRGPFRWVVMAGKGGQLLAFSAPFNLPGGSYEIVQVKVVLDR